MASAGSGPQDERAGGEPGRSLQHMLRAIAEERSRAGLRQEISGLGEWWHGTARPSTARRRWKRKPGLRAPGVPAGAALGGSIVCAALAASRHRVTTIYIYINTFFFFFSEKYIFFQYECFVVLLAWFLVNFFPTRESPG